MCACTDSHCTRHDACMDCDCEHFVSYEEEIKEVIYIPESVTLDCPICANYDYVGCAICRERVPVVKDRPADLPTWVY
jgi:hypothetical protein